MNWFAQVQRALCEPDPARKCALTADLPKPEVGPEIGPEKAPKKEAVTIFGVVGKAPEKEAVTSLGVPGRPARPVLVAPESVPRRGFGQPEARAALVHAVAHIEFNAINLGLDACWRFRGMPPAYYADWLSVAQDEARHFGWLAQRLGQMGYQYGDFEAHNGLWDMAEKTAHDPLARMALVPRVLEARGLDVTPGIIARLRQAGDHETVAILERILAEEVAHVAIGNHWYALLCRERGVDPHATFRELMAQHRMQQRPPFNLPARRAAGFSQAELESLGSPDGLSATR